MGIRSELRVIGRRSSPFVARATITLNLKGVHFEFLHERLGAKSDLLLKSNPIHKKIPVLLHRDKPVCESLVIVQYIDEAWSSFAAPSVLASDPYDRAIARLWAAFLDNKFYTSLVGLRKTQGKEEMEAAVQQLKENHDLLEEAFLETSKGKPFFSGEDRIGFLDIAFGCYLGWMGIMERMAGTKLLDQDKTPHLAKLAPRFMSDPARAPSRRLKSSSSSLRCLLPKKRLLLAAAPK